MAVEYVKGVHRHSCLYSVQTVFGGQVSIKRRLGQSEGFERKGSTVSCSDQGFFAAWYIEQVDVVGYADVDWPRAVMNRGSWSPLLQSALPAQERTCEGATELYLHHKAECDET